MKIYIYDRWKNAANNSKWSFKTIGRPVVSQVVDIESINYNKIIAKLASLSGCSSQKSTDYLAVIDDLDYKNAVIGNKDECWDFIKNCLRDIKSGQ